jgi:hypothetical protein
MKCNEKQLYLPAEKAFSRAQTSDRFSPSILIVSSVKNVLPSALILPYLITVNAIAKTCF